MVKMENQDSGKESEGKVFGFLVIPMEKETIITLLGKKISLNFLMIAEKHDMYLLHNTLIFLG